MNKNYIKALDFKLIAIVWILFTVGLFIIASATDANIIGVTREVKNQILGFAIGNIALVMILLIDYQIFKDFYRIIYVLSLLILFTVYIPGLGIEQFGARSWIDLKFVNFQPAELSKIGFIISYAHMLSERKDTLNKLSGLIVPVGMLLPFVISLLLQPDLGTALVFVVIAFGMMFCAGLSYKIIGGGLLLLGVSMPLVYSRLLEHQKIRIDAFLNPNDPTLPGYYQVAQSKITIGSGMFWGRGLFKGQYHRHNYLPVRETDFIFAVLGEELGFIGGALIIFMYFLLLSRLISISIQAKDDYGSLIVMGIVFMFAFQIIENIGMTMGIMPVTGLTLPFISYGGSSIMTSLFAIGLALNVNIYRLRGSLLYEK